MPLARRLSVAESEECFPNYQQLWETHKLRFLDGTGVRWITPAGAWLGLWKRLRFGNSFASFDNPFDILKSICFLYYLDKAPWLQGKKNLCDVCLYKPDLFSSCCNEASLVDNQPENTFSASSHWIADVITGQDSTRSAFLPISWTIGHENFCFLHPL